VADDFEAVTNGAFGQMEATVGTDLYQAQVEVQRNFALNGKARSLLVEAQASALRVFSIIALMVAFPCTVWLWRWAV
jgi:hypothetical protein